jgi:hypothetical protein
VDCEDAAPQQAAKAANTTDAEAEEDHGYWPLQLQTDLCDWSQQEACRKVQLS